MTVNIKLEGSRLTVVDPCPILADGSKKRVIFRLQPDAEWDGLTITVVFRRVHPLGSESRSVVISNRDAAYYIPHEVLHDGWLYIGAAGVASNGSVKLTTAKLDRPIRVYESEDDAADPSGSITPDVADQILALIGTVSNLDTVDKSSLVAAINELHGNTKGIVKSVNQIAPNVRGDVNINAESINTQVPSLAYLGSVEGALEALATMHSALPVARGISADGIAYTATGDDLPTVSVADNWSQIIAVGKGRQIVFVPMEKNQSTMPTLQINGGEVIPIRMRAPRNQGDNDDAPDATQPIWIGALMRGVPYTMTFCGKYWLIDSRISQFDQYNEDILNRYASALMGLYDGDTVAVPIINSMDEGVDDGISTMSIRRSTAENDTPDQSGDVTVPTEKRVAELIRKDSRLPVARGSSADGIAYTATGDELPVVQKDMRVGKGRQIVFIPDSTNKSNAPTLQLNGGEVIPIRLRAPKNQGTNEQSPDATLPVPVGALMSGVPYTLTFCGLYWLIDSQICGINQILKFNITKNADGTYTSDKTFSDLKTAHDGGRILICSFEDLTMRWDSAYLLHLSWATALSFGFSGVLEPEQGYKIMAEVWINSSNNIGFTATEINDFPRPTALDIGKVMAVSENGNAEWTAVTNAEEVAV